MTEAQILAYLKKVRIPAKTNDIIPELARQRVPPAVFWYYVSRAYR
jgi:hypothetical protein